MNDSTLEELKIVVERAVRPVRARMVRKGKMREELLAHLATIFEEEAARLGDDQAALERAKRRFGDPGELTTQLQQAVPRWDWLVRLGEAGQFWPGESPLCFAGRITIRPCKKSCVSLGKWVVLPNWLRTFYRRC